MDCEEDLWSGDEHEGPETAGAARTGASLQGTGMRRDVRARMWWAGETEQHSAETPSPILVFVVMY